MNPTRRVGHCTSAVVDPLVPVLSAFESGCLAMLIGGGGLSRRAVIELLKPESDARIRAVLDERLALESSIRRDLDVPPSTRGRAPRSDRSTEGIPPRGDSGYGTLLPFRSVRERS